MAKNTNPAELEGVMVEITPVEVDIDNMSEEQLEELAEQEATKRRVKEEMLDSLASAIEGKFVTRASKRKVKENQWLRAGALFYGKLMLEGRELSGETPWEKPPYSNRPDVNVVRAKCNIAIAETYSMQFGTSDKNWDLVPDKKHLTPANITSCDMMSLTIEQQLTETDYPMQCLEGMKDRVIIGTGILKGPLSVGKLERTYVQLEGSTTWVPDVTVDYAPCLERVNPWFFYPDDTTNEVKNLQDTIETHPMSAFDLKKLLKHEGFDGAAIAQVLEQKPAEYVSDNWADFAKMSDNNPNLYKNKYLVLEYHGPITKAQLDKLDIECSYDSINDEYYGEVWVCQGKVIRIELEAIEASYRCPYYISVWEKDPSSVFGFGVALMMEDAQRVVNEAWHMILDNTSISSGPQVAMQKSLIEPANGKWELTPQQIWYLTDSMATVDQAIQFFNVPNVTANIIPILQMAQGFAEEESCIPLITAGLSSPEVADTATGGLMVRQSSTTLLDFTSKEWDTNMTAPIIEGMYGWNMQYNPDPEIKGVYSVDVRTSTEYKNKQLHIRDLEKLSVEAAQNPAMAKWINQDMLQRVRLEMMSIPPKGIIKTEDEVAADEAAAAANAQPDPAMLELELKARELSLKEAQLEFELQQQQQREAWEHEEKMTANQARLVESEARVAVSQNEKETEMLKLAQRSEEAAAKIMSNEKIAKENNLTKAFQIGVENTRKSQENDLYAEELQIKKDTGSGV